MCGKEITWIEKVSSTMSNTKYNKNNNQNL